MNPTVFILYLTILGYVIYDVSALSCRSIQDGDPVGQYATEQCAPDVAACLKKVNKGSKRYAATCDRAHQCSGGSTEFSDSTYDYYCCYTEGCNSANPLALGMSAITIVALKTFFL